MRHLLDARFSEGQHHNYEHVLKLMKARDGAANDNSHTLWAGLPDIGAMLLVLISLAVSMYLAIAVTVRLLEYVFAWVWK